MLYNIVISYRVTNKRGTNLRTVTLNTQVQADSQVEAQSFAMDKIAIDNPILISGEVSIFAFDDIRVNPPL